MTTVVFNEFTILLGLTALICIIASKLKQPLILAFILAGVIAGPYALNLISAHSQMDVLASFGITLLLFIVGLKLDVDSIKAYGTIVLLLGLGQIFFTLMLGYLLCLLLGFQLLSAAFIALTLTFSSTIIIIKSLSDKNELDSLYGRISIGILIVQDLVVVLAVIILSSINAGSSSINITGAGLLFAKTALFLALIVALNRIILPFILDHAAKSKELLVLFALAFAAILAMCSDMLGFGKEIGGFLAGVALASSHYRESIAARLESVRNLLLVFFFINLGASLQFDTLSDEWVPVFVLSTFVLAAKPLIVILLMSYARFRNRTAFMSAITMGQVSEFSLILAALAHELGYIDGNTAGLIIIISLITIAISTYMLDGASLIYNKISPWLPTTKKSSTSREDSPIVKSDRKADVILYGYGRHGEFISGILEAKNLRVLAVDFDPRKVKARHRHDVPLLYGDAEDAEFIKSLPLDHAKCVVSTLPSYEANKILVSVLREVGFKGKIVLSAYHEIDLDPISRLNTDLVLIPYRDAALSAAEQISALMKLA